MKTETTIRRARNAVGLIIGGAIRHIEIDYGPDESSDRSEYIVSLFDAIESEMEGWNIKATMASSRRDLVDDMQELLNVESNDDELRSVFGDIPDDMVRNVIDALLVRHDLLP